MGDIIQSISALADGLISIIDFLGTRLLEGIKIIGYAVDAVSNVPQYLTWAPVGISSIIGTIVLIAVFYRILGWGD